MCAGQLFDQGRVGFGGAASAGRHDESLAPACALDADRDGVDHSLPVRLVIGIRLVMPTGDLSEDRVGA